MLMPPPPESGRSLPQGFWESECDAAEASRVGFHCFIHVNCFLKARTLKNGLRYVDQLSLGNPQGDGGKKNVISII